MKTYEHIGHHCLDTALQGACVISGCYTTLAYSHYCFEGCPALS